MPVYSAGPGKPYAKATALGSASSPTTNSATFILMSDMTSTVETIGGNVTLNYDGSHLLNGGEALEIALYRDGVIVAGTTRPLAFVDSQGALDPAGSITMQGTTFAVIPNETPGSHTYEVYWRRTSGSGLARCTGTARTLEVAETPLTQSP